LCFILLLFLSRSSVERPKSVSLIRPSFVTNILSGFKSLYDNRNIVDRTSLPLVLTTVCFQFFIYLWIIPWLWRYSSANTTWNIRTVTLSFFHLLFLLTIMTFVKVNIEWPELYKVLTFAPQNIPYCVTMI
jgi:FlaA1/EpsC-like NDP-sugar epimerase